MGGGGLKGSIRWNGYRGRKETLEREVVKGDLERVGKHGEVLKNVDRGFITKRIKTLEGEGG